MAREHRTWVLPPPAERITPAIARDWLRRVYPKLAGFALEGYWDALLRPPRHLAALRCELAGIAGDVVRIATACAEAIATGRAVPMRFAPPFPPQRPLVSRFKLVLALEQRSSRFRRTGVRGVLRSALRRMERDVRRAA